MYDSINDLKIENVMIFVSDSLRWDYTPSRVKKMGLTFKTIASSLYTSSSFPSIFTGMYPPRHGVFTWEDKLLPWNRGILDVAGYDISLRCETTWTSMGPEDSQIHSSCGNPPGTPLSEMKEPFIYIEDDKGGHCPYGFDFSEYDGDCPDFFEEYGKKPRRELVEKYERGVKKSVENFEKRLKTLEDRGIKGNTLVIFTSDHGELLGEYGGLIGHGRPACPELVYVPTVFIHPGIKCKRSEGFMRHVDLYPTIMELLAEKVEIGLLDGVNVLKKTPKTGLSFREGGFKKSDGIKRKFDYKGHSVWDQDGGFVLHKHGKSIFLGLYLYKIMKKHPEFIYMINSLKGNGVSGKFNGYREGFKHLTDPKIRYDEPNFDVEKAKSMIDNYLKDCQKLNEKLRIRKSIGKLKI